jgi:transcriptional regulator with XRE-family HTH domain
MARRSTPVSIESAGPKPAGKRRPKVTVKQPRPERPNAKDPMSEPSRHRRVWAAYLSRGMSRADFARAMGTRYQVVDRWDCGEAVMGLDAFLLAAQVTRYSVDELAFGKGGNLAAMNEPTPHEHSLGATALRGLLEELGASGEARSALGVHRGSREGRYQDFTRSYVEAWIASFTERRAAGDTPKQASAAALIAAVNARAQAGAIKQGTGSVTRDELAAIGRRLLAEAERR